MQLVTKTLEKVFEKFPLYSQDGKPINEKKVLCKYFTPWGANTWIVTEASRNEEKPGDWDFFGVVTLGYEWEWGYFSLSELQGIRGQFGLGVERERYGIDPGKKTVYEVLKAEGNGGAEFAEEMLEWEREEEAQDEQPETKPEPEEVQPETQDAKQPEPLPDPWPIPENLESLKYNTDDALKLFKDNSYKMPDVSRRAMEDARKQGFYTDLERFSELAKIFIKGVQDKDPAPVLYAYYWLENCGDHNAAAAFLGGGAAEYIDLTPPKEPDPGSLESYEYSAEAAAEIVKKDYGKFHALADEIGERNTKFRNWGRDCDDLERLAKLFIKGVQENDPQRVLYAYYTLEDINYHQVNRDFLAGKAADYIQEAPKAGKKMELIGSYPQFGIYWYLDGDRAICKEGGTTKTATIDFEGGFCTQITRAALKSFCAFWPYKPGENLMTWHKPSETIRLYLRAKYPHETAEAIMQYFAAEIEVADRNAEKARKVFPNAAPEQPAAPVIRIVTESAAPFAVLVDD